MEEKEAYRMADALDQVKAAIEEKSGWSISTKEQYGTLYITIKKSWFIKPNWADRLIRKMETNPRMKVDRIGLFGYGLKERSLSSSLDLVLAFVTAIDTAESMPEDSSPENRAIQGTIAMNLKLPHFGGMRQGQGSMG